MALTEAQAKVLAALAGLKPTEALTVRRLCSETCLSASTVRAALGVHSYAGWVLGSARTPADWRITAEGRALLATPAYRDYLNHPSYWVNGDGR
ncbi:hypothetical protein ACFYOW_30480 [Nocardia sp. NPDC006982]|uniref:hypothetical protein n=1 Tax=Nocardia sp. NPDC006982 TaxID=3364307 RepID=UPI00368DC4C7